MNWALIFTILVSYFLPLYLAWRFFFKRGIYKWAFWTSLATLFGPVGYIVFAIGYRLTYGHKETCPNCSMETPAENKLMTNEQGETLKEPILAWAALTVGIVLTLIGVIMVFSLIFGDMGGFGSAVAAALVLGTSSLSWGSTQIQKFNTGKENHTISYFYICSACGHYWEKKVQLAAKKIN
jgi:hypothetical protein